MLEERNEKRPYILSTLVVGLLAIVTSFASVACSLVSGTECEWRPQICPPGTTCRNEVCVDADVDSDFEDVDSDIDEGDAHSKSRIDSDFECAPDASECVNDASVHRGCDQNGFWQTEDCEFGCNLDRLECNRCLPDSSFCSDDYTADECHDDGRGSNSTTNCDVTYGMYCNPVTGQCFESCSPGNYYCVSDILAAQCLKSGRSFDFPIDCSKTHKTTCNLEIGFCDGHNPP